MSILSCRNLCLGWNGREIQHNLNFEIHSGDYLCILGENGAGKSTLMKTLLGLPPAISGSVETGEGLRQNEIGYLPQQTQVQRDFPASVWEIVRSGFQSHAGLRPFYSSWERAQAKKNMERLGISEFSRRSYQELSGGQQQRVLLARALCATQKCLLLDEPVSGLDPKVTGQMYRLIQELNREGITIIMVSHDLTAALQYASHILQLGATVFFGTKEEYLKTGLAGKRQDGREAAQ